MVRGKSLLASTIRKDRKSFGLRFILVGFSLHPGRPHPTLRSDTEYQ